VSQAPLGERGGEELDLAISGLDAASARGLLGLRFDRGIDFGEGAAATASLKLGWAREIVDTQRIVTGSLPVLPGSSIALQSARPRRDSALLGAGLASRVDGGLSAFVRYDGDLNGADDSHAVIAGVRFTW
jgi:outer membrane autotransporter protein